MKFSISREQLLSALQQAVNVSEKKTTMPILANVLLDAQDDRLTLTATDLEVCLVHSCESKVETPGRHTLPAKSLFDIIREFPRDDIEFELVENGQVEIRSQKAQFRLMGIAAEDFPAFPEVKESDCIQLDANRLREMIDKTSFSISSDEMRYNLNGILFESASTSNTHNCLRLVSTDGHRLSLVESSVSNGDAQPFKDRTVLPKKGVLELKRLLDDSDESVDLGFDGNNAVARFRNNTLYMRKIIGEFPDYTKVIPQATKKTATVNRQDYIASLKRMLLMSSAKQKLVRFDFNPEYIEMTCQNPELGTAREEIDARFDGEPLTIGFNPKYFIDALNVIDQKEIDIGFVDELSPALIESVTHSDGNENRYQCVIMPMRL